MTFNPTVIGILRGVSSDLFGRIVEASFSAGLRALEVTINTPGAEKMLEKYRLTTPPEMRLGMGTVRNVDEARKAIDAGAMFLVSPNLDMDVIAFSRKKNVPVVAGAFTPTEVCAAIAAGADMVKVFPCSVVGPEYIKALLGPFDEARFVAVGGVTRENVGRYFAAGARAVGVSASLFGREALEREDMKLLSDNVRDFIAQCPPTQI